MNCEDAQALVHGYNDGELDLVTSLELERHVRECASCAAVLADIQSLGTLLRESAPYFTAPPGLASRVRSSLRRAARPPRARVRLLLVTAASVALVTAAGLVLFQTGHVQPDGGTLTRELVASHVRSQMLASHRFDVASSDPHTVKPWFQGKVDFAPPAKDLTDRGYPLIGGRLDYLGERPVAAIVYRRRQHVINLFVWPSSPSDTALPDRATRQGFHLLRWRSAGLTFWAVSDLNEPELHEFARLVRE